MNKPIVLIGIMGCGKTSIGYKLSYALSKSFFDTDDELVKKTGVTIRDIFDIEGEAGFRKREVNMLGNIIKLNNIVLATGGGIVLEEDNRKLLKELGFVIYLKSSIDCLYDRLKDSKNRPLLANVSDKKQALADILAIREPLYLECADVVIDVSYKDSYAVVDQIKETLSNVKNY